MDQRPNILWITTDQQRFDTLGCMGNEFVHTPNLDALATNGMVFENTYCQNPICTPSRSSFLTGRYPRTCRVRGNGQDIPDDEILLPRMLHDAAAYRCGLSGKFHLSVCSPDVCPDTERRIDDGYTDFWWSHNPRRTEDGKPTGNQYHNWLEELGVEYKTRACQHLPEETRLTGPPPGAEGLPYWASAPLVEEGMPNEHHQSHWCADRAIDFVRDRAEDGVPWLFSLNFYDPHHPMDPPAEYLERYISRLDEIPLPAVSPGELDEKPSFQSDPIECQYKFDRMSEREHRLVRASYWAMIDQIDHEVGRVLNALEETGQRKHTLVIFTSDHGEMLGDHGIYLKGPYFYEPAVRVPLIVSMPGTVQKGVRSSALVELLDLSQTILDACGLPAHPGMQGLSLWPILTGRQPADVHRTDTYCEYYNSLTCHDNPKAWATMLRSERYKIVRVHGLGADQGELYDLREDPGEFRNLWNDNAHRETKERMLISLCDRMAFTSDPLPERTGSA
jgi:arylsulfatase